MKEENKVGQTAIYMFISPLLYCMVFGTRNQYSILWMEIQIIYWLQLRIGKSKKYVPIVHFSSLSKQDTYKV